MQNKGTDYIRRILKGTRHGRNVETNNAVPFLYSCFLYNICVLILPAITLEKKTT